MQYYYVGKFGKLSLEIESGIVSSVEFIHPQSGVSVPETPLPDGAVKDWLDQYHLGTDTHLLVANQPSQQLAVRSEDSPKLKLSGTEFQRQVWELVTQIPYGQTLTYGQLAQQLVDTRTSRPASASASAPRISPRAVGQAVGANRIALFIPCHRVVAANGISGYRWGAELKYRLLEHEAN